MSKIPQLMGGRRLTHNLEMAHGIEALIRSGVQTIDMSDATVTLSIGPAASGETRLLSNHLAVDPNSMGANEKLLLPPEASCKGLSLDIDNTGGEVIIVKDDSDSTTVVTIDSGQSGRVNCDGTTWRGFTGTDGGADDFGSTGIKADVVAESTSAAGVTVDGVLLKDGEVQPATDATANGTGVVATSEQLQVRTLTLTLTNTPVVMADEAGVVAYGSLKIADMPEGAIAFLGGVLDLDLTKSSAGVNDDWDGDIGLGTTAASNNATLSGTEQNIVDSTATPQASGGATTGNAQSSSLPGIVDGTSTAADIYLNILVDDADHDVTTTPCNIICNGTVKVTYVVLGDY